MRIQVLEYVKTIAECQSLSKAARIINIQQTTLSAAIRSLEEELGYSIFTRTHHGVKLTTRGEYFLRLADDMLLGYKQMQQLDKIIRSPLSIYVNLYIHDFFLNEVYVKYFREFSKASINIYKLKPNTFWQSEPYRYGERKIGIDQCELNLLDYKIAEAEEHYYKVVPLKKVKTYETAYISKQNALASREFITMDLLQNQTIILGKHSEQELLESYGNLNNHYLIVEGQDMLQIMNLISTYNVIAIFSSRKAIPAKGFFGKYEDIVPIPIHKDNQKETIYQECLIYRKDLELSNEEKHVLELIVQNMQ